MGRMLSFLSSFQNKSISNIKNEHTEIQQKIYIFKLQWKTWTGKYCNKVIFIPEPEIALGF